MYFGCIIIYLFTISGVFQARCSQDHPHHTIPHILALANSYEDFEGKVKPEPEVRIMRVLMFY